MTLLVLVTVKLPRQIRSLLLRNGILGRLPSLCTRSIASRTVLAARAIFGDSALISIAALTGIAAGRGTGANLGSGGAGLGIFTASVGGACAGGFIPSQIGRAHV